MDHVSEEEDTKDILPVPSVPHDTHSFQVVATGHCVVRYCQWCGESWILNQSSVFPAWKHIRESE